MQVIKFSDLTDKERRRHSRHVAKLNRKISNHRKAIVSILCVYLVALVFLGLYLIVTSKHQ